MSIKFDSVHCEDFWDFADIMCDNDGADVSYIGDFEDCAELLKNIFSVDYDDLVVGSIDLAEPDICGYDGPYHLNITSDGMIFCEQAIWSQGEFYDNSSDVLYVKRKYLEKAIDSCDKDEDCTVVVAYVGENVEEAENDQNHSLGIIQGEDGKPCGFTYHEKNDDGECFDYTYCSCTPLSFEALSRIVSKGHFWHFCQPRWEAPLQCY